jgi:hypothetical protein
MSTREDNLPNTDEPDRVHYQTGVLLNDDDFLAEQTYHRGRLARALTYIGGSGTLAGLFVDEGESSYVNEAGELESQQSLQIAAGLAIDPIGRLIEVPRPVCLRLETWYQQQKASDLINAWHPAGEAWSADGSEAESPAGLVLDLMLEFVPCERGKTPAFAEGPFNSIDAVTIARVRDYYKAHLFFRERGLDTPIPDNPWPDFSDVDEAQKNETFRQAIFGAWQAQAPDNPFVYLATVVIETPEPTGDSAPERPAANPIGINNRARPFVLTANALARWLNINLSESAQSNDL